MQSNEYDWIEKRKEAARLKLIAETKQYVEKIQNTFEGEYQWDEECASLQEKLLQALEDNEETKIMR